MTVRKGAAKPMNQPRKNREPSVEGVEWTEDYFPCWPIDWPQHHNGYVPEDLSLCSLRPATHRENVWALELP